MAAAAAAAAAATEAQSERRQRLALARQSGRTLTPENMGELMQLLHAGLSADAAVRTPAEATLEEWRELPGYFSLLKEVVVHGEAPLEVRWLGACCFKNGIKRSWRRSQHMNGGITAEEKVHLRTHLLLMLDVLDERIAKQIAEIVGQIARFEFPASWPELIPAIVGRLDASTAEPGEKGLAGARVILRALRSVLRELSTKRLKADRLTFQELGKGLVPRIYALWTAQSTAMLGAGGAQSTPAEARAVLADIAKYCTKVLRMLLVGGSSDFSAVEGAMPFVNALPHRLQATVDAYTQLALAAGPGGAPAPLARQLLKCVLAMSGTGLELMKELPGSCWSCGSVTPYLEFFRGVLLQQASYSLPDAEGEGGRGALEPLLVHAMLYIMQVLKAEENATADVISAASPEGAHVTAAAAAGQAEALEVRRAIIAGLWVAFFRECQR